METPGGCYICGGPVDLSHPEVPADAHGLKLEDHHGGGLYVKGVLVGFNLFPLEWSMGWGADPKKVAAFVRQLHDAGLSNYSGAIDTQADVMAWVDSTENANVRLCSPHHTGHQTQHTPDVNGHEAVGIHNAPWPVLAAQAVWDWAKGDMFGGTTGTVVVAPHPLAHLRSKGYALVTYAHEEHTPYRVGQALSPSNPHAKALYGG